MNEELFKAMAQSIMDGDADKATELANQAIAQGISPLDAINKGFVVGVQYVGNQFACGDAYLPELVMAGEAMKAALSVLEVELAKSGTTRDVLGRVVIGTVEGDIHDIGKTLVGVMLSITGFQVYDLGVNVPTATLIDKAKEVGADIIAASALLTTTMPRQKDLVKTLESAGLRSRFKVLIGGAPVTAGWVTETSADGYSEDAVGAAEIARQLVQTR